MDVGWRLAVTLFLLACCGFLLFGGLHFEQYELNWRERCFVWGSVFAGAAICVSILVDAWGWW